MVGYILRGNKTHTDLEGLLSIINNVKDSIDDAAIYTEYGVSDAFENLSSSITICIESILSNDNLNFENELSDSNFLAWKISLQDNIDSLTEFTEKIEGEAINAIELRNSLEEEKINLKTADAIFNKGDYTEAIEKVKTGTIKLHNLDKKWRANYGNLKRSANLKVVGFSVAVWVATIYQYPKMTEMSGLKPLDVVPLIILIFIILFEHKLVQRIIRSF